MEHDLKRGKSYTIIVAHKFEAEFSETVEENGTQTAIFLTGGSNRYGPNIRKVPLHNIISSELKKT